MRRFFLLPDEEKAVLVLIRPVVPDEMEIIMD
jgi:hypothetical protein